MRVLVPDKGRAVFLALSPQQLKTCLDSKYVKKIHVRAINIGGNVGCIVLALRSKEPFFVPGSEGNCSFSNSSRKWDPIDDNLLTSISKRQRFNSCEEK
jgi:hypothetical protein